MKIIKANAELVRHDIHPYKFIERVGRTCYKSEEAITDESALGFIENLNKNGHRAMLEHEYLYMRVIPANAFAHDATDALYPDSNHHVDVWRYLNVHRAYISGSFRAFIEVFEKLIGTKPLQEFADSGETATHMNSAWVDIYTQLTELYPELFPAIKFQPIEKVNTHTEILSREAFIASVTGTYSEHMPIRNDCLFKLLPHTIKFTCDRGVTHELVRHRPMAWAQESTRYCDYSKDKFDKQITVIEPCFYEPNSELYNIWKDSCEHDEKAYFCLRSIGATAQQARDNLPTSLKAEIIATATEAQWQHFMNLRFHGVTGKPHPQMYEVAAKAYNQLHIESEMRIK